MGALFLTRETDPQRLQAQLAVARSQFERHRLPPPQHVMLPGCHLLHSAFVNGGPDTLLRRGDDVVAVAGTLSFDGRLGEAALERLLDAVVPGRAFSAWDRIGGHFAAVVHKAGRTLVFTDFFGAFQLFLDEGEQLLSTSLLSVVGCLPRLSWHHQGVYEFAFNVFPIGNDTVFREVRRLGPERQLLLDGAGVQWLDAPKPLPVPERLDVPGAAERLRAVAAPFVHTFGSRMDCPLSGGFDSRLVLGMLRSQGVAPHVYVYGSPGSEDVDIAQAIGHAEGFAVEAVDKWARVVEPDAFPEIVARNFEETDALATDGGFFDTGGNGAARDRRQREGRLAVSGGCGEVFRNFFYLPDRPMRAGAIVDAFYSTFDPADATAAFDAGAYREALEAKVRAALGGPAPQDKLPRRLIEEAYPRIRCRAFFGREISLVGRFGAYLMPFLERPVVAGALALSMQEKAAGRFQSRLISAIDPALARHKSTYGHAFDQSPAVRARLTEAATRLRPLWLRRNSYRLKRRLGPVDDGHGGLTASAYLGRVIDLDFPAMRNFFQPERITDSGVYRRVATLEYLAGRLGSQLC